SDSMHDVPPNKTPTKRACQHAKGPPARSGSRKQGFSVCTERFFLLSPRPGGLLNSWLIPFPKDLCPMKMPVPMSWLAVMLMALFLVPMVAPAQEAPPPHDAQPQGALSGARIFVSAGHGWYYNGEQGR